MNSPSLISKRRMMAAIILAMLSLIEYRLAPIITISFGAPLTATALVVLFWPLIKQIPKVGQN
jgi:hypothetical protein